MKNYHFLAPTQKAILPASAEAAEINEGDLRKEPLEWLDCCHTDKNKGQKLGFFPCLKKKKKVVKRKKNTLKNIGC